MATISKEWSVSNKPVEIISVRDHGAICDGVTDDTAAVQAAIDYAISFATPLINTTFSATPVITVPGMCLLTASIDIDRPDNQTGFLRIRGEGTVGGFLCTTAITMFSTTYVGSDRATPGNSVLTNQISFEQISFGCPDSLANAYAVDATKYVRTQFLGCHFTNIGLNADPTNSYIQSLWMDNCFVRSGNTQKFMQAEDAYDVHVTNCLFEVVSDTCIYFAVRMVGCSVIGNLAQNCGALFVNTALSTGLEISGNYTESNTGRFCTIDDTQGTTISGNYIQTKASNIDAAWFEVKIGEGNGCKIQGNYFTSRGVEVTGTAKNVWLDSSNYAVTQLVNTAYTHASQLEGDLTINAGQFDVVHGTSSVSSMRVGRASDNGTISSAYSMFFNVDDTGAVPNRTFGWRTGGEGYSGGTLLASLDGNGLYTANSLALGVITLANDATPSVLAGAVCLTGGTTTITDFDDGTLGQTIQIRADHAITITHNASIIRLDGAANFVMASGDTLTLTMFTDQVWHETSRLVIA